MLQTVMKIVKWVSIPVLLIASLFACCVRELRTAGGLRDMFRRHHLYTAGDPVEGILLGWRCSGDRGSVHPIFARREDLSVDGRHRHRRPGEVIRVIPAATSAGGLKQIVRKENLCKYHTV